MNFNTVYTSMLKYASACANLYKSAGKAASDPTKEIYWDANGMGVGIKPTEDEKKIRGIRNITPPRADVDPVTDNTMGMWERSWEPTGRRIFEWGPMKDRWNSDPRVKCDLGDQQAFFNETANRNNRPATENQIRTLNYYDAVYKPWQDNFYKAKGYIQQPTGQIHPDTGEQVYQWVKPEETLESFDNFKARMAKDRDAWLKEHNAKLGN